MFILFKLILKLQMESKYLHLMGAFFLRWALLTSPPELLSGSSFATSVEKELFTDFGPEAGRVRGGGRGADPGNRRAEFQPRSKVFDR